MDYGITGIYKIKSIKKPWRIYIGSSWDIRRRMLAHFSGLRKNRHGNQKLQRHYNKYGEEDLVFSIVMTCSKNETLPIEQFFIDAIAPYFNICPKADSPGGMVKTEDQILKATLSLKENVINGWVPWNKGKTGVYSRETILKMKEATKSRWRPVLQYDLDMNLIKEWDSIELAADALKIFHSGIYYCLKGRYHKSGGFIWKYKEIV